MDHTGIRARQARAARSARRVRTAELVVLAAVAVTVARTGTTWYAVAAIAVAALVHLAAWEGTYQAGRTDGECAALLRAIAAYESRHTRDPESPDSG